MAENKRFSLGGRVATPRVPSNAVAAAGTGATTTGGPSLEQVLGRVLGAQVRLQSINPSRTHTGYIFALSPSSLTLTLTQTSPFNSNSSAPGTIVPAPTSYTVLSLRSISSLTIISVPSAATSASKVQTLPTLDPQAAAQRISNTVAKLHAADARRGKGVTREAQGLFDALYRTLPVTWDGPRIVVLGSVVIHPPYTAADCRSMKKGGNVQELTRVKKVVESERRRLAAANGATSGGTGSGNVSTSNSARATPELRKGG